MRMMFCALSISPALQPDHLARAQTCAVAESEHDANPESPRRGKQAFGLVRAHHQGTFWGSLM